jgi:hypothetical protein
LTPEGPATHSTSPACAEEPVEDGTAEQRIQVLKDLDPDEQWLFALIVNAAGAPQPSGRKAG